jgi:arylsulfatase A-like enzyme
MVGSDVGGKSCVSLAADVATRMAGKAAEPQPLKKRAHRYAPETNQGCLMVTYAPLIHTESICMSSRSYWAAIAVGWLSLAFGGFEAAWAAEPAKAPNLLMIVGDDMGYADVGFHGCRDIPTPHLDALAKDGVRFTQGYVSGPYCSPTRAGLLTGRYQTRFGHEFNPAGGAAGLPLTEQTLPDRLKAAGYRTGMVGKWHLGGLPAFHPQRRGFDEFFGFLGGAHSYLSASEILRGTTQVADEEVGYLTDAFSREACGFIERQRDHRWFLYLTFNAVHTPMHATDERMAKFAGIVDKTRRTYAAMMVAMDDAIGAVRAKLAASGQADHTVIAFISDNGGPTMPGTTTNGSSNAPLRGSKRTTLEGGIRVPYLLAWPGTLKPGVFQHPAIQLDLHTTLLAAAGIQPRPEWKLEGVDLWPYLKGEKSGPPHDSLFWRFGSQMAIREGDWKLVRYDLAADAPNQSGTSGAQLFDLVKDPSESKDLSAAMPDKVAALQKRWDSWNASNKPALWGGATGKAKKKKKG